MALFQLQTACTMPSMLEVLQAFVPHRACSCMHLGLAWPFIFVEGPANSDSHLVVWSTHMADATLHGNSRHYVMRVVWETQLVPSLTLKSGCSRGDLFRKAAKLRKAQEALDAELQAIKAQTSDLDEADRARLADLLAGRQVLINAAGTATTPQSIAQLPGCIPEGGKWLALLG